MTFPKEYSVVTISLVEWGLPEKLAVCLTRMPEILGRAFIRAGACVANKSTFYVPIVKWSKISDFHSEDTSSNLVGDTICQYSTVGSAIDL